MNSAFIFPGQGSQIVGMGKVLFNNFNVAKNVFEEVDDALSFELSKIIFEGSDELLMQTENTQPALMATSIAAIRVIEDLSGKKYEDIASISAGHSLGQYSALCAAGAIDLRTCANLLKFRGKFMQESALDKKGSMAAVIDCDRQLLGKILDEASAFGSIQIANDNSIEQIVISGEESAIDFAIAVIKDNGVKAIKLKVSAAFHSDLMQNAADKMKEILQNTKIEKPKIPVIDNVSLEILDDSDEIKDNLVLQIPSAVRWRETMYIIVQKSDRVFEVGPGKVLTGLFKKSYSDFDSRTLFSIEEIENFVKQI